VKTKESEEELKMHSEKSVWWGTSRSANKYRQRRRVSRSQSQKEHQTERC